MKVGAHAADGDGDPIHLALILLESSDEGGVVGALLGELLDAAKVPTKSHLYDDENAIIAVEICWVR